MTPETLIDTARGLTSDASIEDAVARYFDDCPDSEAQRESAMEALAMRLWHQRDARDLPLIRVLTRRETALRRHLGGCGDALYALCHLLYRQGHVEDVLLLYAAKRANLDAGAMLEPDLLTLGRSREELLHFLDGRPAGTPEDSRLRQAVERAFDSPSHDSLEALCAAADDYLRD
ncbi:hypothetical protein HPC49_22730 [Pyxidicoccus fallax]|uniref:Uncharacterized protein n=1 Tax=Pyxidicoccus fallax TaxID=394095 RepID=A0A848LRW7_9BACT|nr:hypothetical protein [Pyxidicoccus fallax]NMO20283.1 hypothetical protein [Pyxidicoccus fallax]NPC81028.1 hypothetical protein [Pyxidicoccus fallax]